MRLIYTIAVFLAFGTEFSFPFATTHDTAQEVVTPNPIELSSNWWQFFQQQDLSWEQKETIFFESLQQVVQKVPENDMENVGLYISKIVTQFKILKDFEPFSQKLPPSFSHKSSYSFNQIVDITEEYLENTRVLDLDNKEFVFIKKQTSRLEDNYDNLFSDYVNNKEKKIDKLILGLDLISTRLSLEIKKRFCKNLALRIDFLYRKNELLSEELSFALDHFEDPTLNIHEIEQKIVQLKTELKQREEESLKAELQAMRNYSLTEENKIQNMLLQQSAIDSLLDDAIIHADILILQFLKLLVTDETQESQITLEKLYREFSDLEEQNQEWKKIISQDLDLDSQSVQTNTEKAEVYQTYFDLKKQSLEKIHWLQNRIFFGKLLAFDLENKLTTSEHWTFSITKGKIYFEQLGQWLGEIRRYRLYKMHDMAITVEKLFIAIICFLVVILLGKFSRYFLKNFSHKFKQLDESTLYVLDRLVHYVAILIAFYLFLYALGLDPTNIILVIGGLSVGVGLGLQSLVNNFVCSLMILFYRMIRIGDMLQLPSGEWGKVLDINVQNTIIHTWDGIDIVVPNSELLSQNYQNWTRTDKYKRLHIPFDVAYGSDKELVKIAGLEAADQVRCTIKGHRLLKDPQVWLVDFKDSALSFELVVWINLVNFSNIGSFKAAYRWEIETALRKHGIVIPFPQRDVHFYRAEKKGATLD